MIGLTAYTISTSFHLLLFIFISKTEIADWREKWKVLKTLYVESTKCINHRRSNITEKLKFLRPEMFSVKNQSDSSAQESCFDSDEGSDVVVDASDSEFDFQMLNGDTTYDGCLEILKIEDDGDDIGVYNQFPTTNADHVHSLIESCTGNADEAFGVIIAQELRKMSPTAKRKFKRNVTNLLYS